jgi:hypothetical protein
MHSPNFPLHSNSGNQKEDVCFGVETAEMQRSLEVKIFSPIVSQYEGDLDEECKRFYPSFSSSELSLFS